MRSRENPESETLKGNPETFQSKKRKGKKGGPIWSRRLAEDLRRHFMCEREASNTFKASSASAASISKL